MTKEEKIRESWVKVIGLKNYEIIKNDICENGTIYEYHLRKIKYKFSDDFIFIGNGDNEPDEMQLQSLQGIENNNFWTKIESEADLPKEDKLYLSGKLIDGIFYCHNEFNYNKKVIESLWNDGGCTHYQPITKPEPPLY